MLFERAIAAAEQKHFSVADWDVHRLARLLRGSQSQCSVQAGQRDWRVSTFTGMTIRGYVLNARIGDVEERISAKGLGSAQALPPPTIKNVSYTEADHGTMAPDSDQVRCVVLRLRKQSKR
jgi:hypothetical protein